MPSRPTSTYDFGLERRLDFSGFDFEPIDTSEERMGADVFLAGGGAAQSLQRRFRQELREDKGKKEWNCSLEKKKEMDQNPLWHKKNQKTSKSSSCSGLNEAAVLQPATANIHDLLLCKSL